MFAAEAAESQSLSETALKELRDRLVDHAFAKVLSDDAKADVTIAIESTDVKAFMAACAVLAGHRDQSGFAKGVVLKAYVAASGKCRNFAVQCLDAIAPGDDAVCAEIQRLLASGIREKTWTGHKFIAIPSPTKDFPPCPSPVNA